MIDAELNEKVKLQYELDAKAKRYKKILKAKYKTGGYSPSKHGLEPTTPSKKYQEPVLPINKYFGSSTPAKMAKMSPPQTQDAKSMLPDEDDKVLLHAMGSVNDDEISFAEAETIINGDNDNPMTSDSTQIDNESKETTDISENMPVENCNGIKATTVDDTDNDSNVVMTTTENHSKKQPDITSVKVNVNNKRVMPTKSQ